MSTKSMLKTLLLLCRQSAVGCKLVSLQVGDIVVMATQAAIAALVAMQFSMPTAKKALRSPKPAKQPLLAKLPADISFLGDLVPEAVSTPFPNGWQVAGALLHAQVRQRRHMIIQA